eukprot:5286-Hanusia_phi.AAC.2
MTGHTSNPVRCLELLFLQIFDFFLTAQANVTSSSLLTFLGKSPPAVPSKARGKADVSTSHAFMNTSNRKKGEDKGRKRKAEATGGRGKKASRGGQGCERSPFDMTPIRTSAREEKTPDTEEKYPRSGAGSCCKETAAGLDGTSTKLLEDETAEQESIQGEEKKEQPLIVLDSPERPNVPSVGGSPGEGGGEQEEEPMADAACRRSQRIRSIASTAGSAQKKEAVKRFFMSKEEKARLAEEERKVREEEEREREEERKRMRVERANMAREKLREEMEKMRQETQKLNQGKQINPFLLPRSLRPASSKMETDTEGDQSGLFRPSSFQGLAALQDSNPDKFPFPIVSHVLPTETPVVDRSVPPSQGWKLREPAMEEADVDAGLGDERVLVRESSYSPLPWPSDRDPTGDENQLQSLAALTNTGEAELRERMEQLENRRDSFLANNSVSKLWTEALRPQRSSEVVGNSAAVQDLMAWLQRSRDGESKLSQGKHKPKASKASWCSESDSDDAAADSSSSSSFSNALVLLGPTGSGKTASLYACCEELRLRVIEINPSDQRTGKNILQMVGEATRSYLVRRGASSQEVKSSQESAAQHSSPDVIDLSADPATPPKAATPAGKGLVGEMVKCKREGESVRGRIVKFNARKRKYEVYLDDGDVVHLCIDEFKVCGEEEEEEEEEAPEDATAEASLVLFEEVDVLMDEDKGFMSALISLMEQTQVPVVLTCSAMPPLIKNLGLKETRFDKPSQQDILLACGPLCLGYRKETPDQLAMKRLQQAVRRCRGDLRASLMAANLEFAYPLDSLTSSRQTPVSLLHDLDEGIHQHRYELAVFEEIFHEYPEQVGGAATAGTVG